MMRRRRRLLFDLDRHLDRCPLVPPDELVDVAVEGGREQQGLAVGPDLVEDRLHLRQEAHVGHAVRFVDDDDRHVGQPDRSPGDQVPEPARTGHRDVDAATQRGELAAETDAAVEGGDSLPAAGAHHEPHLLLDLSRQLAGGREHQCPGLAGTGPLDPGGDREPEGDGLARSRRRLPADVLPVERRRDGQRLDRERGGDAAGIEGTDGVGGHAEVGKGRRQETHSPSWATGRGDVRRTRIRREVEH